jgi:restriction system protein
VALLFDHLERRRHVVTLGKSQADAWPLDLRVTLEQYLEDLLAQQWDTLPWADQLEYIDRQVNFGKQDRLDILAKDRTNGDYVVIELKRDQGDDEVVGQVSRYMGWIKQRRADHQCVGVRGIIVAHEATPRLRSAVLPHSNISLYRYQFSVALAPIVATAKADKSKASC